MPKLKPFYQEALKAMKLEVGWVMVAVVCDVDSSRTVEAASQGVDLDVSTYERICDGVDEYRSGK